jgi:SNF2 family DNA or RNA helicase
MEYIGGYAMTVKLNFKTTPYAHQVTALERSMDRESYGFFMEMGTGKSKVLIDTISNLHLEGKIDFALIIAPKGVYRNWVAKEIPEHMPDEIEKRVIRWVSSANREQEAEIKSVGKPFGGLTLFVMNVEAFSALKGKQAGEWLAKKFGQRGLIGIDESTTIKNHKAKRTKALIKIASLFKYRRLLTGSPVTKSPMDVYAQCEFLGPRLLGCDSYYAFQGRYAVTQKRKMGVHSFEQIIGYKNLDDLSERLDKFSYRVLKKECLDLPERTFTARYVTMTSEQYKMYDEIRKEAFTLINGTDLVSTPVVITQLLRLQQVLSGHLKTDEGDIITFKSNRMEALLEILEEHDGKAIIWSRFRHDIVSITETLNKEYGEGSAASYFGGTSDEERNNIVRNFQNPGHPLRFFVGNPATAGYGLTLTEANLVVYYANDYSLEHRLQSQDRVHRIGQRNPVTYVDLITEKTVDEKIVAALRNKIDIGAAVLREEAMEWLRL